MNLCTAADRTPSTCPARKRVEKTCVQCSARFLIAPNLAACYVTCSDECSRARRRETKMGDLNPQWAGDSVSPASGRQRARQRFPLGTTCVNCNTAAAVDRHHIDGNTLNNLPANIQALCRRCHMLIDGRLERLHPGFSYGE